MLNHFFISLYRNFKNNKLSTFLNLVTLVIGFATFAFLGFIVNHELNYDKFNKNYKNIYRVQTKQEDSFPTNFCTFSPSAYRYHLLNNLPEVEKVLLMKEISGQYFSLKDGSLIYDQHGYWSENTIFDIFTVNLKEGSVETALTEPNTILLSESLSKKIFPEGNATGKEVIVEKRHPLKVTGVYQDFPENSSLRPSFLISMSTFEYLNIRTGFQDNWTYIDWDNFILLKEGTDPESVDAKIKDAFKSIDNFEKSSPYLHHISKFHTSPNSQSDFYVVISVLSLAAFLILILSCINYVNLSLANSTQRAREIGIKKVAGSPKKYLQYQFMGETLSLTFISMILGLIIAQLSSPLLNLFFGRQIEMNIFSETNLLLIIILVGLLAGILSGLYPSLVLSSYNPVKVLKGNLLNSNPKSINLKKILIVSQFSITLFMLTMSMIFSSHVNFMMKRDLGFRNKEILFSEINFKETVDFESVRNRLLQHPEIVDASVSSTIPFMGNIGGYVTWDGASPDEKVMISRNYVNYNFIPTYGLELIAGRNFSKEFPSDANNCIINETAFKTFGWDNIDGKKIYLYGRAIPVTGVVKDFHPFSIHQEIPVYIMLLKQNDIRGEGLFSIRYLPGNEQSAQKIIKSELESVIPNEPFEFKDYSVLLNLDLALKFWKLMKRIFIFFSIVTVLLSLLGLLGLMIFTIKHRMKEIGIRKVLGSSVIAIYRQLSAETFLLMLIAFIIATPLSVLIFKVLPGAYKEPLNIGYFLISFGIVTLISILTISYHVIKISVSNPVDALRYE